MTKEKDVSQLKIMKMINGNFVLLTLMKKALMIGSVLLVQLLDNLVKHKQIIQL
jgi:hypothetical protein